MGKSGESCDKTCGTNSKCIPTENATTKDEFKQIIYDLGAKTEEGVDSVNGVDNWCHVISASNSVLRPGIGANAKTEEGTRYCYYRQKEVDNPRTCSSTSNVVKRVCKCEGERTGNVEEEWKEIWKTPDWCNNKCDIGLGESLETGGNNCKRNYTKEQCDSSYFQETNRSGKLCYWNGNSCVPWRNI